MVPSGSGGAGNGGRCLCVRTNTPTDRRSAERPRRGTTEGCRCESTPARRRVSWGGSVRGSGPGQAASPLVPVRGGAGVLGRRRAGRPVGDGNSRLSGWLPGGDGNSHLRTRLA